MLQHAPTVHRYLLRKLGDRTAADDATQETFARALTRLPSLRREDKLVPWLLAIARNVSFEQRRARRRPLDPLEDHEEQIESSVAGPEAQLLSREAACAIRGALGELKEDRRTALLLRVEAELPYEEIASSMGWSLAKVKNEIHRARSQLRAALALTLGAIALVVFVNSPTPRGQISSPASTAGALCVDAGQSMSALDFEQLPLSCHEEAIASVNLSSVPEWPPMCR